MSPKFALFGLLLLCVLCQSRVLARSNSEDSSEESDSSDESSNGMELREVRWPSRSVKFGQIGGVAFQNDGKAVVFHRASRRWQSDDFDDDEVYTKAASEGKIKQNTVVVIDEKGQQADAWGANLFYMPHGLTIDHENNVWVTDVAAHQVFKFTPNDKQTPALTLGEALKPGSDATHFCKPTDIAVASNGDFFVADGYCNSRILKFDRTGKLLSQFGEASGEEAEPGSFSVPHSLALIEEDDSVCVADRENDRVQCFDAGLKNANNTGSFKGLLAYRGIQRVYAIAYDKKDSLLHGLSVAKRPSDSFGFSVALNEPEAPVVGTWQPARGFITPHDITVSPNGEKILVGDVSGDRLSLFSKSY